MVKRWFVLAIALTIAASLHSSVTSADEIWDTSAVGSVAGTAQSPEQLHLQAVRAAKLRRLLEGRNLPFDAEALLRPAWRKELEGLLYDVPEMARHVRQLVPLSGVILADTLEMSDRTDASGDTVVIARRLRFTSRHPTIRIGPRTAFVFVVEPIEFAPGSDQPSLHIDARGWGRGNPPPWARTPSGMLESNANWWPESDEDAPDFSAAPGSLRDTLAFDDLGQYYDYTGYMGANGGDGQAGQAGNAGRDGSDGSTRQCSEGGSGTNGGDGVSGSDGMVGGSGSDGSEGGVGGWAWFTIRDCCGGIYTIDASGGAGGWGGDGGKGGNGGAGGRGGSGGDGNACEGPTDGGSGGNGGNGGIGGDGGNGGNGGNGGWGGYVEVTIETYSYYTVCDPVITGGPGGAKGKGGGAGASGAGGSGGTGGQGAGGGSAGANGTDGNTPLPYGRSGNDGMDGSPGFDGTGTCWVHWADAPLPIATAGRQPKAFRTTARRR